MEPVNLLNNDAGLCPSGWRVPTDKDWQELVIFLGMNEIEAQVFNMILTTSDTKLFGTQAR